MEVVDRACDYCDYNKVLSIFRIYIMYLGPGLVITVLDCTQPALLTHLLIKKIVFRNWVMNICTLQSGYL